MMTEPSLLTQDRTPIKLRRLAFLKVARLNDFLERFDQRSVNDAKSLGADILVFCDRPWMGESFRFPLSDRLEIALLSFNSFDDWFSRIEKYRRNEVRKSAKEGVEIRQLVKPSLSEAQQILDLYQESPFREGRYFVGYHSWNLRRVMEKFGTNDSLVTSIALHTGRIVGIAKSKLKGEVAVLDSLISSLSVRRKVRGVATSLLASQVEMLSNRGVRHLEYGKLGVGLDSLDHFKTSNGFRAVPINYNYLLLTRKAKLCAKFGFYKPQDIVFSTRLRFIVPLLGAIQPHIPVKLIQKLHLYA